MIASIGSIHCKAVGYIVCGSRGWCYNPIITAILCNWQWGCICSCQGVNRYIASSYACIKTRDSEVVATCGTVLNISSFVWRFGDRWRITLK